MPSINPLLLRKVLVFAGTGGSPLIYYGSSSDVFSEGLRKFKLSLSLDQENQSSKSNSGTKRDETWTLSKDTWQGISEEKWKQLLTETEKRNIYKLFIKSESIQGERAEKGIKGLIGLSKIKLGSEVGAKGIVEEITKEESQNIWLIIAKGEKSIYLMPSVVSSSQGVGSGSSNATEQEKKIWGKGVEDIKEWKADSELLRGSEQAKNKKLHESIQKGFIVARGGKYISKANNGRGMAEQDYEGWLRLKNSGMNVSETMGNVQDGEVFYNNAGIVWGKKGEQNWGWLVIEKWNEQREKYFPLDIFVLGDNSKMRKKFERHKSLIQEIEVEDNITEVIGVRLDQIVISETGIGEGEKNEIKWGTIQRPTWTQELLK